MRKRIITLLLAIYSVFNSFAQGYFESGGIRYQLNNVKYSKTVTVVPLVNDYYKGDIIIPSSVVHDGVEYTVTQIGALAFAYCHHLTSISIPDKVYEIGDFAFADCDGLNEITIPQNVETICTGAFINCTGLVSITMPQGPQGRVKYLFERVFNDCKSLTSITIPASVIYIKGNIFQNCSSLESIVVDSDNRIYDSRNNCNAIIATESNALISGCKNTIIPHDITIIGSDAFNGCTDLDDIYIPSGVISIGNSAFSGCSRLSSVTIPENVTSIDDYSFAYSGLTSIHIPSGITSIGKAPFTGCSYLNSITVDSGNQVFDSREGCNAIIETKTSTLIAGCNNTIIPQNICRILDEAFMGCIELDTIKIPASVYYIGYNAFQYCNNLESITIDPGNTVYDSRDDCNAFIETNTNTLIYGCKNTVIPTGVTYIAEGAFEGCNGLTSITIPGSVEEIGGGAFAQCYDLKSVVIQQGVKKIGYYAFGVCLNLISIEIPSSIEHIGDGAFYCCRNLASITIPETVDYIGYDTFNETAWYNNQPDGIIYINKTLYKYKGDMPENTNIIIKEGVKYIADFAFDSCTNLTSIIIPNSVISINRAFQNCSGLRNVTIPESVREMYGSFLECSSLVSINIPDGITRIGSRTFEGCTNLISVTLPKSLEQIDDDAFKNCLSLKSIAIPEGVNVIYDFFDGCTSLKSISVPSTLWFARKLFTNCDGIDSIYWNCPYFSTDILGINFESIKYIEFGDSVKSILNDLYGFYGLTAVTFYSKTPSQIQIGDLFFREIDYDNCTLYVPWGARYEYMNTLPWSKFKNIVATDKIEHGIVVDGIRYEITSYQDRTVSVIHNDYSGSVIIPATVTIEGIQYCVTGIETEAFSDCTELTKIHIPQSVTSLAERTFENCIALTDIFFEDSPEIEKNVFIDCPNIQHVTSASSTPGKIILNNPFVCGEYEDINVGNITKKAIYNNNLSRIVTEISSETYQTWSCSIVSSNFIPSQYKLYVGILPNIDSLQNRFSVDINAILDDQTNQVIFKSKLGGPRRLTWQASGIKYDSVYIADITIPENCKTVEITITTFKGSDLTNRLVLDRIFFEPLDFISEEKYTGPFTESVFNNATLFVPESEIETYKSADGWRNFKNIAFNSGVKPIEQDNKKTQTSNLIHNITGRRVLTDAIEQLQHGLYIINGRKYLKK